MAWWTDIIFSRDGPPRKQLGLFKEDEKFFVVLYRALRQYISENFIDVVYFLFGFCTYGYLGLVIAVFFFAPYLPHSLPHLVEVFSEPYLGALGIYVVVKEIERRRGRVSYRPWGELFAVIWFVFFITATALTFFSSYFHANEIYKTIVTNALAAFIIRIGSYLR